jgi:hypothetical protein
MKMTLAEPKLKFLPAGAIFWLVREGLREGPTIFVDHPDRFTNVSRSSPVAGVLFGSALYSCRAHAATQCDADAISLYGALAVDLTGCGPSGLRRGRGRGVHPPAACLSREWNPQSLLSCAL